MIRNGYLLKHAIQRGIGPVTVKIPKIRSHTETHAKLRSALVLACIGKALSVGSYPLVVFEEYEQ